MTNNYAIEVKSLGKKYNIARIRQGGNQTLANSLINSVKQPVRRIANLVRGNSTGAADLDQEFWAVRNVNFTVKHGESVGVIGHNGAGKSTLLKLLSRITRPSEGWARINGRVGSLLEVGTGFNPELTGRENIFLNGSILGMQTQEINAKFDEIIEFSGVTNFVDTPVKHYSSGMTVRLAFAVAAHLEPEILLVDEVLSVGDYAFQKKSLGKMQDVTKSGRTVLFVSHQLDMVREICNRTVLLKDGQVVMIGETNHVIDSYLQQFGAEANLETSFTCPIEPERPFQILGGRILNDEGNGQHNYDVFDPITIEIDYCLRQNTAGLVLNFVLYRNGEPLAVSFDSDTMPERLETRLAGQYKSRVTLPSPLLKEGHYNLEVNLGYVSGRGVDLHQVEDALNFEVSLLSKSGTFLSYDRQRRGKIALALDWHQTEIGKE